MIWKHCISLHIYIYMSTCLFRIWKDFNINKNNDIIIGRYHWANLTVTDLSYSWNNYSCWSLSYNYWLKLTNIVVELFNTYQLVSTTSILRIVIMLFIIMTYYYYYYYTTNLSIAFSFSNFIAIIFFLIPSILFYYYY